MLGFGLGLGLVLELEGQFSSKVIVLEPVKAMLVLDEGLKQGLNDTTLTAAAKYSVKFSRSERQFCLSLHYNGSNSFVFVNTTKINQFKAKVAYCVWEIFKKICELMAWRKQD